MNLSQLQGLWYRDWLHAENHEDNTSCVYWAQAGDLFVDVRVPNDLPDLDGHDCLATLSAQTLTRLLSAEGFAGTVSLSDDICTWNREINWHGQTEEIDAGKLSFSANDSVLLETGIHASYAEQWSRVPGEAFTAHRVSVDDMSGILINSASRFFFAIGIPGQSGLTDIQRCLENGVVSDECRQLFLSEYSTGHWHENAGVADSSTQPFQTGKTILHSNGDSITWQQQSFDGEIIARTIRS
ncbi:MAG: hypothetical protein AB8B63_15645 [Granulosicoccus sp.]